MNQLAENTNPTTFDNAFTKEGNIFVYQCDGMPTYTGCSSSLRATRKIKLMGPKPSGWLVTPAFDLDNGGPLDSWPLFFCPECRKHVQPGFK